MVFNRIFCEFILIFLGVQLHLGKSVTLSVTLMPFKYCIAYDMSCCIKGIVPYTSSIRSHLEGMILQVS